MINNELYHYGVPGMRWGRRKPQEMNGQNTRVAKKQPYQNKKPSQSAKPEQKQEPQQEQPQSSSSKKGLIIAVAALATIGALVLASKYGRRNAATAKKIETGKKIVEKQKKVKIPKEPKVKVPKVSKNQVTNTLNKSAFMPGRYVNIYR